jgi:hypothetical protein
VEKSYAIIPKFNPFDSASLLPINSLLVKEGLQLLSD